MTRTEFTQIEIEAATLYTELRDATAGAIAYVKHTQQPDGTPNYHPRAMMPPASDMYCVPRSDR